MASGLRTLWVFLTLLCLRVCADCTAYGVDYSNGGSYYIDGNSNQYFSFITLFQDCSQETVNPVLVSPDGNQYACTSINTQPAGVQVTSQCGIPFSAMASGTWRIIVQGRQVAVQRSITLTVGAPATVVVTATPTVVVGVTSTLRPSTVLTTIVQTQTLILVPQTVTAACNGGTRTVTNYPQSSTTIITSTILRTTTEGQRTSYYATTVTSTAICHYSQQLKVAAAADALAPASVNAITSTYTQTSYTVTSTITSTVAGRTTTEAVLRTTTSTVTPPPSTVCNGNGGQQTTLTVIRGDPTVVTQTSIAYRTTTLSGTVWVGSTAYTTFTNTASASACWKAGGWYGR